MSVGQLDLFDSLGIPATRLPTPRPIDRMHKQHGEKEAEACRTCAHLHRYQVGNGAYYKCHQYGVSAGASTDWRLSWPACGLWLERQSPEIPTHGRDNR